ncbi:hypothetical protein BGZ70_009556 [Mortierella alpina]|uniref:Uncharacterized protein n=1 Tax=Mortierella alpina TaxID=64518 RepID=A0A9P6J485_MORAP|nr:hypothetical protein BGZ70_009556 [Mortierella alpina]
MKFTATLAIASTVAALASAQTIQINNPTQGSKWTVGATTNYLGWTGNCAGMGNSSKAVDVELVQGPPDMVRYVTKLAAIDCSGTVMRTDISVPTTVVSGKYSIRVKTTPQDSYSNEFTIENGAAPAPPAGGSPSAPATADPTAAPKNAASSLAISSFLGLAGVAVAALQFAL